MRFGFASFLRCRGSVLLQRRPCRLSCPSLFLFKGVDRSRSGIFFFVIGTDERLRTCVALVFPFGVLICPSTERRPCRCLLCLQVPGGIWNWELPPSHFPIVFFLRWRKQKLSKAKWLKQPVAAVVDGRSQYLSWKGHEKSWSDAIFCWCCQHEGCFCGVFWTANQKAALIDLDFGLWDIILSCQSTSIFHCFYFALPLFLLLLFLAQLTGQRWAEANARRKPAC